MGAGLESVREWIYRCKHLFPEPLHLKNPFDHAGLFGLIVTTLLCLKLTILTFGRWVDKSVNLQVHQLAFSSSCFPSLKLDFLINLNPLRYFISSSIYLRKKILSKRLKHDVEQKPKTSTFSP